MRYMILTVEHLETSEYVLSTLNKVCMYLNQRHCRKEVDRLTPDLVLSRTECCRCPNVRVFVCVCVCVQNDCNLSSCAFHFRQFFSYFSLPELRKGI